MTSVKKTSDRKILVVEDDSNSLEVIKEVLLREGYQVQFASSADEAFIKIEEFQPDLVLTDNDMPGYSGLEMLRELRQKENYVTVIFISGRGDVSHVSATLRAGADDYIRKPFRFEELLARVEVAFRTYDLHEELVTANKKLQHKVDRDYLTGLFNMRSMYERIDFEIKRSRRFKRSVAAVMIDMDHFKTVNDNHDHLFGSFVLKEVGQLIQQTMREIDFAARYGGDEFLIVLTEADVDGTKIFCERLRKKIEGHTFVNEGDSINLTVSIGFAVTRGDLEIDSRSLVRQADHQLYEAKGAGRNCSVGLWAS